MDRDRWTSRRDKRGGRNFRWMMVMAAGMLAAGCSDDALLTPDSVPGAPTGPGEQFEGATSVAPFVRRVELDVNAAGSFRPGQPITVTGIARGRRAAQSTDFNLVVLDEETAPGNPPPVRQVQEFRGAMGRGAEQRLVATLTFAKPGLYRVVASSRSQPPADENLAPADSVVGDFSSETLYLLIDENGGRATREYVAPEGRSLLYGSFGPFIQGVAIQGGALRAQVTTTVTGVMWNYNDSTKAHQRLGPTEGTLECYNSSTGVYVSSNLPVNADGTFSFTCASGYWRGKIHLRGPHADVYDHGGAFAGASFDQSMGGTLSLQSSNQYAGYVYMTLHQHVPTANARFGRTRSSRIRAWVSTTDPEIRYCSTIYTGLCTQADIIRTYKNRVFGQDGIFVTMHEFGHAYHYTAIEKWPNTYGCAQGGHQPGVPYSLACAFVEGFADFFAGWILSSQLTGAYGFSDTNWEIKNYSGPQGLITEGAAAGFFYDLVDGSGELDNSANTAATEEAFDNAVYPGTFIANIIQHCSPYTNSASGPLFANPLDGMDQVVYCVEGHVNAEIIGPTYGTGWRTQWDAVSWSPSFSWPAGYSGTTVRTLWKWNFYGTTT
ncbi:MAG TPA: hypothetical protein VFS20_17760 [Longimicrobium sp.]|nr:hypothetical protein [Longimicrobium sp.]